MQQQALWELQEVDQALEKISKEIKQKELVIKLKEQQTKISKMQDIIDQEEAAIAHVEKNTKKLEHELLCLETKKNEQEKNLYAGNCTNPKELSGMKVKLEVI
ncbi:MAG: hypothetical protein ACOYJ1_15480, partial [Peptococcales bacterium]